MTSRRAFGEMLRRQREQRGVTLETISHATKISVSLLAALERGDCSRWPGGIYSRAYIRDYAKAAGLDADEIAEQFTECFADTAFPDRTPEQRAAPAAPRRTPNTPLRVTFAVEPRERLRVTAARVAGAALDLILTLALATIISVLTAASFWMALAGVSVCWQAVAVIWHGSLMPGMLAQVAARAQARRATATEADPTLAEAI